MPSPLQKLQQAYNWAVNYSLQEFHLRGNSGIELSITTQVLRDNHNRTVAKLKLSLEIDYLTTSIGIVTRRSHFNSIVDKKTYKRDKIRLVKYKEQLAVATKKFNDLCI